MWDFNKCTFHNLLPTQRTMAHWMFNVQLYNYKPSTKNRQRFKEEMFWKEEIDRTQRDKPQTRSTENIKWIPAANECTHSIYALLLLIILSFMFFQCVQFIPIVSVFFQGFDLQNIFYVINQCIGFRFVNTFSSY